MVDGTQEAFTSESKRFDVFKNMSDQKEATARTTLRMLATQAPWLHDKLTDPSYPFRMTILGAGDAQGELSLAATVALKRGGRNGAEESQVHPLEIYAEDPSAEMEVSFHENANKKGIKDLVKAFNHRKIEDPSYTPPDSDLVTLSQVMYYLNNWTDGDKDDPAKNPLRKAIRAVEERDGMVAVAIQSPHSHTYQLRSKFSPMLHNKSEYSGNNVLEAIEGIRQENADRFRYGWSFSEAKLNISDCFDEKGFEPNPQGKELLSFIFRMPWDEIPTATQRLIGEEIVDIVTRKINPWSSEDIDYKFPPELVLNLVDDIILIDTRPKDLGLESMFWHAESPIYSKFRNPQDPVGETQL